MVGVVLIRGGAQPEVSSRSDLRDQLEARDCHIATIQQEIHPAS